MIFWPLEVGWRITLIVAIFKTTIARATIVKTAVRIVVIV